VSRTWIGAIVVGAILLGRVPVGQAQVFLSSESHPEFAIGPLIIVGTVRPDLGPVSVRLSWSVTVPLNRSARDIGEALYLLWPGEVAGPTAPGPADLALRRHVEERGFTVVSGGRLGLESRDRTTLGTLTEGRLLAETASFVTFFKTGTNPAQSGMGTFIKIPWTPLLADAVSLMSLTMTVKDMITPKPATWVEALFWGRRHVLTLSAGSAGSVALYSLYFDERDRVVRLGRDFSLLIAAFVDADHLRVEEISPSSATRRPSRLRAGSETITLPIGASEGTVPQTLKVQFSYFRGPVAWRPILVSLALLILGNLMGAFMFAQQIRRFFGTRFHLERTRRWRGRRALVPPPDVLARIAPGTTTHAEVLTLCGSPGEERERRQSPTARTLIYRGAQRVPHPRFRFGRLATVSHWDEEHHEVEINLENDRVTDVQTRVRRFRLG
jgi:hypothetical protein